MAETREEPVEELAKALATNTSQAFGYSLNH